jgi:hypothetical protein
MMRSSIERTATRDEDESRLAGLSEQRRSGERPFPVLANAGDPIREGPFRTPEIDGRSDRQGAEFVERAGPRCRAVDVPIQDDCSAGRARESAARPPTELVDVSGYVEGTGRRRERRGR